MSRIVTTISVLVVLMGSIVVALVASQIGGSRIRASHQMSIGQLSLASNKVLPGVPVNVTYDIIDIVGIEDASIIMVRTSEESVAIGEVSSVQLGTGKFTIQVPCNSDVISKAADNKARLVLVSEQQGVLAQSDAISILPAGPDCFYRK
jgi:hypothetical protein